jgi:hypothetical protein
VRRRLPKPHPAKLCANRFAVWKCTWRRVQPRRRADRCEGLQIFGIGLSGLDAVTEARLRREFVPGHSMYLTPRMPSSSLNRQPGSSLQPERPPAKTQPERAEHKVTTACDLVDAMEKLRTGEDESVLVLRRKPCRIYSKTDPKRTFIILCKSALQMQCKLAQPIGFRSPANTGKSVFNPVNTLRYFKQGKHYSSLARNEDKLILSELFYFSIGTVYAPTDVRRKPKKHCIHEPPTRKESPNQSQVTAR